MNARAPIEVSAQESSHRVDRGGITSFQHDLDRKTMSYESLLVRPKPVKAYGMVNLIDRDGTSSHYKSGIRGTWSSVNLLSRMRSQTPNGRRASQLVEDASGIVRSSSTSVMSESDKDWDPHLSSKPDETEQMSRGKGSAMGHFASPRKLYYEIANRDREQVEKSRTPSPIIGRLDLDKDNFSLRPERSDSPSDLYRDNIITGDFETFDGDDGAEEEENEVEVDEDGIVSPPEMLQAGLEIQQILFQQQRSSIDDSDRNIVLKMDEPERDESSSSALQFLSLNLSSLDERKDGRERERRGIYEDDDHEDLCLLDELDHYYQPMASDEQHVTSISTDAIQHYLDEYSLNDNCPSPPMRASNGIAFDDYFQYRSVSRFPMGSNMESNRVGAEIGLFNFSPTSSGSSLGTQPVH